MEWWNGLTKEHALDIIHLLSLIIIRLSFELGTMLRTVFLLSPIRYLSN
jgi:hypothetical protein